MRDTSRSTYGVDAVFFFQQCERKLIRFVPFLQADTHQLFNFQMLIFILIRNVHCDCFATKQDCRYRCSDVEIDRIAGFDVVALLPFDLIGIVKGMFNVIVFWICRQDPDLRFASDTVFLSSLRSLRATSILRPTDLFHFLL